MIKKKIAIIKQTKIQVGSNRKPGFLKYISLLLLIGPITGSLDLVSQLGYLTWHTNPPKQFHEVRIFAHLKPPPPLDLGLILNIRSTNYI